MIDDFYIGYEPRMPDGLSRMMRATAVALVMLSLVTAGVLVWAQERSSPGTFHYGELRSFSGRIVEHPLPGLEVARESGQPVWHWLVGPGKHGAARLVAGLDGRHVRLSGTLIERGDDRMIEVVPDSITDVSAERTPGPPIENPGAARLDGEIVDSKCYFGVMKPGQGPTHRDCAVRCLLGQVPAMLVVRGSKGVRRIALIVSDGESFQRMLPALAGKPVRVRGALLVRGEQSFLSVSPTDIIPLPRVNVPISAMPDHRHQHDGESHFD